VNCERDVGIDDSSGILKKLCHSDRSEAPSRRGRGSRSGGTCCLRAELQILSSHRHCRRTILSSRHHCHLDRSLPFQKGRASAVERPCVWRHPPPRRLKMILIPDLDLSLFKISTLPLDLQSNPCNNYSVHPDGFGGVSVWQKYGFKRVNPSRTLYAASSARCSRKTLSRRSSATPST